MKDMVKKRFWLIKYMYIVNCFVCLGIQSSGGFGWFLKIYSKEEVLLDKYIVRNTSREEVLVGKIYRKLRFRLIMYTSSYSKFVSFFFLVGRILRWREGVLIF